MACRGTQQITALTPDLRFWSPTPTHLHQALPSPYAEIPPRRWLASLSLPHTRVDGRAGHEPFHGAAVLPTSQGRGHSDCLQGQAGLGVGRPCLRSGGQAAIVILVTDLAGGTSSVRDRQASAYQGIPAGSLHCASEEPSHGDKFQPGLM